MLTEKPATSSCSPATTRRNRLHSSVGESRTERPGRQTQRAITPADFAKLQQAFELAAANRVLLYDIMTERFEITTMLQRELSQQRELSGNW